MDARGTATVVAMIKTGEGTEDRPVQVDIDADAPEEPVIGLATVWVTPALAGARS